MPKDPVRQIEKHSSTTRSFTRRDFLSTGLKAGAAAFTTGLLPNYPNPFNPDTWIPYDLAEDAEVAIHIYNLKGETVRQLPLGFQGAGTYRTRSRAAYWDGCNAVGEPVASGIYFYTLRTGEIKATRQMVILK